MALDVQEAAPDVRLADDAGDNGLANMLAGLLVQNMQGKPHKQADFASTHGTVAIVAEDAGVALTLRFDRGRRLTVHDGIAGIPDLTIRGSSDVIIALSNLPHTTPLGLPIPTRADPEGALAVRTVADALRRGKLRVYGLILHLPLFLKIGRLMSVH